MNHGIEGGKGGDEFFDVDVFASGKQGHVVVDVGFDGRIEDVIEHEFSNKVPNRRWGRCCRL